MIPDTCRHNGQPIYYLLLPTPVWRESVLTSLRACGIGAVFHYVPLPSSPAGRRFERPVGVAVTDDVSARLVRLPLWPG